MTAFELVIIFIMIVYLYSTFYSSIFFSSLVLVGEIDMQNKTGLLASRRAYA